MLNELMAITSIDGRYRNKVSELAKFYSEFGLIHYRVRVEIEYFIALCGLNLQGLDDFPKGKFTDLRKIYEGFNEEDALEIKNTEKTTNHDVKAVEYFIKDKFRALQLDKYLEFIHFGLTSQDINNTSIPLSLKEGLNETLFPQIEELIDRLGELKREWKDIPMLAHTHGQPASPTYLGKEIQVFEERLKVQYERLMSIPFSAKFGGAVGNFNAHHIAYPHIDWVKFANDFVNGTLELSRSQTTTQIEHYDNMAALFDAIKRVNTIILDLDRDIWTYISMNYFKQRLKEGEVGSSTMPHKVNPIDFENSEGNLGVANAIFEHLSAKLPVSRMQRDLTDSTVLRTIGTPIAHSIIAIKSTLKGLDKLLLNEDAFYHDLEENWAVVAEAIQTVLRRENFPAPYEALKALTRKNSKITKEGVHEFIEMLEVNNEIKAELKKITPHNYTGINLVS